MIYGSVCSGIEAATVAWEPLGWRPAFFSEIEKFPSSVLAHHYPETPNYGDMLGYGQWPGHRLDILVGGTPCQSFSIAGLRKGLDDPRGSLMLTYLAIARRYQPRWLVWENVPGVLSSNKGRDFGTFLGALAELGYGFAYRVLDAQYVRVDGHSRAVPQRRRRVFVVGYPGDWRRAAAVLFEPESLQGHPAPCRKAGQDVAPATGARTPGGGGPGTDFDCDGGLIASTGDVAHCLNAGGMGRIDYETETMVAHALRGEGHGGGHSAVAWSIMPMNSGKDYKARPVDVAQPLMAGGPVGGNQGGDFIQSDYAVRRLTPTECERLQGFPDGYTDVPPRNRNHTPDGPRYKALGNSMAVNVMRWIGRRIDLVETFARKQEAA